MDSRYNVLHRTRPFHARLAAKLKREELLSRRRHADYIHHDSLAYTVARGNPST